MFPVLHNVAFDCADPYRLAQFWSHAIGHPVHPECRPGDEEVVVVTPPGGPDLYFSRVPEGKAGKNRVHICLRPTADRDEEVARFLALGARPVADHRGGPHGRGWMVLADPEGNEFCILHGDVGQDEPPGG